MELVLSLFTGIGMLDDGFKKNGCCVVSAGDTITNQPIQDFKGIKGKFEGVIGGSPCQGFSTANRKRSENTESLELFNEFKRVVIECEPSWFLLENVPQVPQIEIEGYKVQRFNLNPAKLGFSQNRNRCFQFGSKKGLLLDLPKEQKFYGKVERCAIASEGVKADKRKFEDFCRLQGFSEVPTLESFTQTAKYNAVGNGVHIEVSRVISRCILDALKSQKYTFNNSKTCLCGCGSILNSRAKTANQNCRKRLSVNRRRLLNINYSQIEM